MSKKILIVDDDVLILKSVKRLLSEHGYEPTVLKDAQEAINMMRTQFFEAILTDVRMPSLDGVAFVKQVRRKQHSLL